MTDYDTFDVLVDGVKVGAYHRDGCFSELALPNDNTRAVTIVATSLCVV